MLLRLHATAHERGGTVTLVRPPDKFLRVLAVTTMGERFRIRETDEDVSAPPTAQPPPRTALGTRPSRRAEPDALPLGLGFDAPAAGELAQDHESAACLVGCGRRAHVERGGVLVEDADGELGPVAGDGQSQRG